MNGAAATADGAVCPHVALIKKRAAAYGSGGELSARRRTAFDQDCGKTREMRRLTRCVSRQDGLDAG